LPKFGTPVITDNRSMANIFEHFSKEEVGISFGSLRNYGLSFENPYENKKVVIRKGILQAKPKQNLPDRN